MSKGYSVYLPSFIYISDIIWLNISLFGVHKLLYGAGRMGIEELNFVLLANLCWAAASALSKGYIVTRPLKLQAAISKFLSALIYLLALLLGLTYLFKFPRVSNLEFTVTYSAFFILVLAARSVSYFGLETLRKRGYNNRRIIIIGDGEISQKFMKSLKAHPEYGYQVVRYMALGELTEELTADFFTQLLKYEPHEIFVCYKQTDNWFLNKLVDFADANFINVKVVSDLFLENKYATLINYDHIPAMHITSHPQVDVKIMLTKRSFDIAFSLVVMTAGFPVFLLIFLITKLCTPGPAFYKQQRIGKNGKPFDIYKFRSMYQNAEAMGPRLSSDDDPRITKWGRVLRKTRLDELPQFWNVLKGDMSVVGPRPERQHFIDKILERKPHYNTLLTIRPGITSMGQVGYGYAENLDQICDRVNHDLPYLHNMTINSDIQIIMKTIKVMVQCKGK